uniref:NADH-ubiquinone oxidoreductase chain 4L n=1 Tax=Parevania sp. ZJUH_2016024 TaxID=2491165 RepID=A0A3S8V125_9HYME|nr:NADH dehydrogenase subunit 4L [Parevania sp. ZJUH_2016024]
MKFFFLFIMVYFMMSLIFLLTQSFLMMLVSLEFLTLSTLINLYWGMSLLNLSFYVIMYFLVFVVCEAVLGLSILVMIMRESGSDYFLIKNLKW